MAPSLWRNRYVAPPPPLHMELDAILVLSVTDSEYDDEGFIEAADIDWTNIVVSDSEDDEEAPADRWRSIDELRILFELIDGCRKHGHLPPASEVFQSLQEKGLLKRRDATAVDVARKVTDMKERFRRDINSGGPRDGHHNRLIYDLSAAIWGPERHL